MTWLPGPSKAPCAELPNVKAAGAANASVLNQAAVLGFEIFGSPIGAEADGVPVSQVPDGSPVNGFVIDEILEKSPWSISGAMVALL